MWPAVVTVVGLFAIGVGGFLYFTKLENKGGDTGASRREQQCEPGVCANGHFLHKAADR